MESGLSENERKANEKLIALRKEVANDEHLNQTIHNYFDYKRQIEGSKLFEVLDRMPKGAVHHIHSMAAHSLDNFLELTKDDRVYYSAKMKDFKVFTKNEFVEEGYLRVNALRKFFADPNQFDNDLKKALLKNQDLVYERSSQEVKVAYQAFFQQFTEVGKFEPFCRKLIKQLFQKCILQNAFCVEVRHVPGMVYNDELHHLTVK